MESPVECLWIDLVGDIKLKILRHLVGSLSVSVSHAVMGMMFSSKESHMPDERRCALLVLKINMITPLRFLREGNNKMKNHAAIRIRSNFVIRGRHHLHLHRK